MIIDESRIKVDKINLYDLVKENIVFPIFQRGYDWTPEQVTPLLDEIDALGENEKIYFLDFIYYREDDKFCLADGQQRITTLYLLIKAIKARCSIDGVPLFIDNFKISYESDDFQKKFKDFDINITVKSTYKKVYDYLVKFLIERKSDIRRIANIIQKRIYIYTKETTDVDRAFSIFKQINSGGKGLTKDEVIETVIKQYSKKYDLPVSEEFKIDEIKNAVMAYYRWSNDNGKVSNFSIMNFIEENIVKEKSNFREFYYFLNKTKDIKDNPITYVSDYLGRKQILAIAYILKYKGIDINTEKDWLENVLNPLCLLNVILSKKKIAAKVSNDLIDDIIDYIKCDSTSEEIKKDVILPYIERRADICKIRKNELIEGLSNSSTLLPKVKKAILIMDIMKRNTSGIINVKNVDLEHCYPQKPSTDWKDKGWRFSSDEEELDYIESIGNYLILNKTVNRKMQNDYILDKMVEYENSLDAFLRTPINSIDYEQFHLLKKKYIRDRTKFIVEQIQQTFDLGNVLII